MRRSIQWMFAMVAVALLAAGCDKGAEDLIVGSWSATSVSETVSGHPNAASNTTTQTKYGTDVTLVYTFNDDKSGTAVQTVVAADQSVGSQFKYTVDSKTLVLDWETGTDAGRSYTYKLSSIDKKKLSFTRTITTEGTVGDEMGNLVPYTTTTTILYQFEKI